MSRDPTRSVALVAAAWEAAKRRDMDALMTFYAEDAVWDASARGIGIYEGADAIRRLFEDWLGGYEEWIVTTEELVDLGNGVVFAVVDQDARPVDSTGAVRGRECFAYELVGDLDVRATNYRDMDEGHAAAERLAGKRP